MVGGKGVTGRNDPINPDSQEKKWTLLSIGLRPPIPPKTTLLLFVQLYLAQAPIYLVLSSTAQQLSSKKAT